MQISRVIGSDPRARRARGLAVLALLFSVLPAPIGRLQPAQAAGPSEVVATFDDGQKPDGWTVVNKTSGPSWRFNNPCDEHNYMHDEGKFAIVHAQCGNTTEIDAELRSPVMDFSDFERVLVRFDIFHLFQDPEHIDVDVTTNGGTTWTTVWQARMVEGELPILEGRKKADISAVAGGKSSVMVRWRWYNAAGDNFLELDSVSIGPEVPGADFNGDGFGDLAIGVPDEDDPGVDGGSIRYRHGGVYGLLAVGIHSPAGDGMKGIDSHGDDFGAAVATGDFNGDGFSDVAVGAPGDDEDGPIDAGSVNVIFGRYDVGLTDKGDERWHLNSEGIQGAARAGDRFGSTLAVGDFDGDGYDDLAIGIPGKNVDGHGDAGAVAILYGSRWGLTDRDQLLREGEGTAGAPGGDDHLGSSLAAGDFDGDGFDDLAIGVPGNDAGARNAGSVMLLSGSETKGLRPGLAERWTQDTVGVVGQAEPGDRFGSALAVGDIDGDGFDDLVVGAPGENRAKGAINGIFGADAGLSKRDQFWHQGSDGVWGVPNAGDRFGAALVVEDINGDGRADAAIGVPGEDVAGARDAGQVNVLYARASGLTGIGDEVLHQNTDGIKGEAEPGDRFGSALSTAGFDGDGFADLAVGLPGESSGTGGVAAVLGSGHGLTGQDQYFPGATPGGNFGEALGS